MIGEKVGPERVRPDLTDGHSRLKVLDVGTMIAGPFCSTLLGDFGADVIKIERPDGQGDRIRQQDIAWPLEGRNKRSVTLDMRTPEGKELLLRLVDWADVFIENFKPGTMKKWGLDYESLSQRNPRLVYVSVSGFGQTGPNSARPGYDHVGAAFGGLWYQTGFPDRPPVLPGMPVVDYFAGTFAALGALEALRRRDGPGGTGKGEWVELGLYEPIIRISSYNYTRLSLYDQPYEREGSMPIDDQPPRGQPQGVCYETSDGRWLNVLPLNPDQWDRMKKVIPEVDRPEFDNKTLQANLRAPDKYIRAWILERTMDEALDAFIEADLPCSPIFSTADIIADPHVQARGNIIKTQDQFGRELLMQNVCPNFVSNPASVRWTGEKLGASNHEVLCDLLGLSEQDLVMLDGKGVI